MSNLEEYPRKARIFLGMLEEGSTHFSVFKSTLKCSQNVGTEVQGNWASAKISLKIELPLISYGFWKGMFVDSLVEYVGLSNCVH